MPENSTHKCTNAANNVQPIKNLSHMAKILSVCNRLQAGDYKNGNGGKRRVSRLTQFIHATLQIKSRIETFWYWLARSIWEMAVKIAEKIQSQHKKFRSRMHTGLNYIWPKMTIINLSTGSTNHKVILDNTI